MGGLSLGTESLSPPIHYGSLAAFLERRLCAGSCYTLICRGAFSSIDRPLLRLFEPGRRAQIGFRDPPPTPKRSAGGALKPHSAASPFVRCVFPLAGPLLCLDSCADALILPRPFLSNRSLSIFPDACVLGGPPRVPMRTAKRANYARAEQDRRITLAQFKVNFAYSHLLKRERAI